MLMSPRLLVAAVAVLAIGSVGAWNLTQSSEASAASAEVVTVSRGAVSVTVGGIGHVANLSDAARMAVPEIDSASGAAGSTTTDAVFARATGHVLELFVEVGDVVEADQELARIADDGTVRGSLIQARSELASARLDLAQKRLQDPARGPPPTAAEFAQGRSAVAAARDALSRLTDQPLPADISAAQAELARATAELAAEKASHAARPAALTAAELAVATATANLDQLTGAPDPVELTAARLELAKAQLEQEALLQQATAPTPADLAAADTAVTAAQERLAAAQAAGITADIATAEADLARAQADRTALTSPAPPPSAAAQAAAALAVEAAQKRIDALLHPPANVVSAARSELSQARADLVAIEAAGDRDRLAAAKASVTAARDSLDLLFHPAPETVSAARADVTRAAAELAVTRQRGSPAGATDIELAGLRVEVARQQLRLAHLLADRLTVRAPASGTVTSVLTTGGAAVEAATPLFRVQDLDHLVVTASLTEFDVSRTKVGARARISADALGGRRFSGSVLDVALSGNTTGGVVTFPVIVSIDGPEDLRPGMSVSVRVVVADRADVVRVPVDAIEDREGRTATVLVRTKSGELREREIELGLVGPTYAEVRAGLAAGDKVAIPADDEEA